MNTQLPPRQQNIILLFGAGFLVLIGMFVSNLVEQAGRYKLLVNITPSDTRLTINGEEINIANTYLAPGEYTIEASRDNFYTKSETVTIGKDLANYIEFALLPATDDITSQISAEDDSTFSYGHDTYFYGLVDSIMYSLPFSTFLYSIESDTEPKPNEPIHLYITATKGYYNAPIKKIIEWGLDPSDYTYTIDTTNPFML